MEMKVSIQFEWNWKYIFLSVTSVIIDEYHSMNNNIGEYHRVSSGGANNEHADFCG